MAPLDMPWIPRSGKTAARADLIVLSENRRGRNLIYAYVRGAPFPGGSPRTDRREAALEPAPSQGHRCSAYLVAGLPIPPKARRRLHPATRTFRPCASPSNDELAPLDQCCCAPPTGLQPGGSGRDQAFPLASKRPRVKTAFLGDGPPGADHQEAAVWPSASEQEANPRSLIGQRFSGRDALP